MLEPRSVNDNGRLILAFAINDKSQIPARHESTRIFYF